jgi:hydrogenase small subunit
MIGLYGRVIRGLRAMTNDTVNKEPKWRHRGRELSTGYHPTTYNGNGQSAVSTREKPHGNTG